MLFETPSLELTVPMDYDSGYFYDIGPYWVLPLQKIKAGTVLDLSVWNISCMFQIWSALPKEETKGVSLKTFKPQRPGTYPHSTALAVVFRSKFTTLSEGGYLITYMNGKPADDYTILVRTPDLVLYSMGTSGALAISPKIAPDVATTFEEQ